MNARDDDIFVQLTLDKFRELFGKEFGALANSLAEQVIAYMERWMVESIVEQRRLDPDTWLRDVMLVCLFFQFRHKFPNISISRACEMIAKAGRGRYLSATAAEIQTMTVDHANLIKRLSKIIGTQQQ